jgi:hypothetical protein
VFTIAATAGAVIASAAGSAWPVGAGLAGAWVSSGVDSAAATTGDAGSAAAGAAACAPGSAAMLGPAASVGSTGEAATVSPLGAARVEAATVSSAGAASIDAAWGWRASYPAAAGTGASKPGWAS